MIYRCLERIILNGFGFIIKKRSQMRLILLLLFCCGTGSLAFPQTAGENPGSRANQFVQTALRDQKAYGWLKELCAIGPRMCGSKSSLHAVDWAEQILRQDCRADRVWRQRVMVPNWKRGNKEYALIHPSSPLIPKELSVAALGGSIGTAAGGITAGVMEVQSLAEIDSLGAQVKDKIIFLNRRFEQGNLNPNESYGAAVDQRTRGAARAGKWGAAAVLVRSVTSKYDNIPHTGITYYEENGPRIPAAALGLIDADFLHSALDKNPRLQLTLLLSCQTYPDTVSYNVIGEITGTEFPHEIILVGAHLDSWDQGCGAHDDGGGCVQAMEVLDLFHRLHLKPKRTIRCVLFMDEEQEQTGAKAYAAWSDSSGQDHLAAIESDRGAFSPRGFSVDADSLNLTTLQNWLEILYPCGIDWIRKGGSGADVGKLKQAKARIGYVPDPQRYYDLHHSANDILEAVHPRELELGSAAIAMLVYLISERGLTGN
jgi:carboxypeptidase Q